MNRPYQHSDAAALKRMFDQQGFTYDCPDFDDPGLLSKMVYEKNGLPRMAILARLTAEVYFLMDRNFGTPEEKWKAFLGLHEASRLDCYARGLDDVCCWIPPQLEKPFGRRLLRLGWSRNNWASFTRDIRLVTEDLKEKDNGARRQERLEQIANR